MMTKEEIEFEIDLSYNELVAYLLAKYGVAKYSYFCTNSCKSKQTKNMRTKDGLFLHHIGEKEHIMLCNAEFAKQWDFEKYQGADKLVYCNYLEHLLLHVKITKEYMERDQLKLFQSEKIEMVGIGGVVDFIGPELVTYYETPPLGGWQSRVFEEVKDNYDEFTRICALFELDNPLYDLSKTTMLSEFMGKSIKRTRKAIDEWKKKINNLANC